jgi:lysophospholipase L1-like esterase
MPGPAAKGVLGALGGPLTLAWLTRRVMGRPARHIREVAAAPPCGRPRVLCLGASMTHGTLSYPWVDVVQRRLDDRALLVNAGRNGSLAINALRRLPHGLALAPRLVIVLVGTNDVHAVHSPELERRFMRMNKLTRRPSLAGYRTHLAGIVDLSRAAGAEVALVTLPPLGEDLSSPENERLLAYNAALRDVAAERGADVIDLHPPVAALLDGRPVPRRPWPRDDVRGLLVAAAHAHLLDRPLDALSARRGLHVTTDGVHLNERSGVLLADLVEAWVAEKLRQA